MVTYSTIIKKYPKIPEMSKLRKLCPLVNLYVSFLGGFDPSSSKAKVCVMNLDSNIKC